MNTITSGKVERFIDVLGLPKDEAMVLLKTDSDCQLFFDKFYQSNKYLVDDLLDFREHKIENSKKTVDEFVKECYTNIGRAFENTFYQSFTNDNMLIIRRALVRNEISLRKIFMDFQKSPNTNIMRNIAQLFDKHESL